MPMWTPALARKPRMQGHLRVALFFVRQAHIKGPARVR